MIYNETGLLANSPVVLSSYDATLPIIGWENVVTAANLTSTTADVEFPVTNLANPATHLKWVGGINTSGLEFVTTSFQMSVVNYVGIARHNFGTQNSFVRIEYATTDSPSDWVAIAFDDVLSPTSSTDIMPDDDSPLVFRIIDRNLFGIRIRITTAGESAVPPEMAVLYVGQMLVLERGIKVDVDHVPVSLGRRTSIVSGMSESGNFMGRVVLNQFQESTAEFSWFTPDWYRANFDPFVVQSKDTPFFFAWNPSEYPRDVGYCWLTDDPLPEVHTVTRRIAVTLEMRGVV